MTGRGRNHNMGPDGWFPFNLTPNAFFGVRAAR